MILQQYKYWQGLGLVVAKETYISLNCITIRVAIKIDDSIDFIDLTVYRYNRWLLSESYNFNISNIVYWKIDFADNFFEKIDTFCHEYEKENIEEIWF